jgi:hypothetical protein
VPCPLSFSKLGRWSQNLQIPSCWKWHAVCREKETARQKSEVGHVWAWHDRATIQGWRQLNHLSDRSPDAAFSYDTASLCNQSTRRTQPFVVSMVLVTWGAAVFWIRKSGIWIILERYKPPCDKAVIVAILPVTNDPRQFEQKRAVKLIKRFWKNMVESLQLQYGAPYW